MTLRKLALLAGAAAFTVATPAAAQMKMNMPGMQMPGMKMPAPKKKAAPTKKPPAKKKSSAKKTAASKPAAKKPAARTRPSTTPSSTRNEGHGMSTMPGMKMPGHDMSSMPGMQMPSGQANQQAMPGMAVPPGQPTPAMPAMTMPPGQTMQGMPGMKMPATGMPGAEAEGTNLPAGSAPAPPVPTDSAADTVYGPEAMKMGRHHLHTFHGGQQLFQVFNNIMEYQARKGRDGYEWNSQGWYGGDIDRLWLRSEGDGTFGRSVARAEVQALYSHAIDPYFNLQGGVRYDFKPNPSRVYAAVGIEGLAPSFFELEGTAFLSNKGELMARAEGFYDQRITQRLILQPRAELNFAAQDSRDIRVGAGLSDAELGVRLRYDIRRELSPYIGVQYRRAFGATRRYQRLAGEDAAGWALVAGIRTWF